MVCGEDHLATGTPPPGNSATSPPGAGGTWWPGTSASSGCSRGSATPGLPYVMLGHSMGSFLTRTYLIRWPGTLDGAVLSGTGQEPAPLVALGRLLAGGLCALRGPEYVSDLVYQLSLGAYNRAFRPNRTTADWLKPDEGAVDANSATPCAPSGPPSPCFGT